MTSKDYSQQRLQDLADNLVKELELLKDYEKGLRYETDPKTKAKYREEIKQRLQAQIISLLAD